MEKLLKLWQNLRRHQRSVKVLPLDKKPYWYLSTVVICTGIVEWGCWQIVNPGWSMFFKILGTHPAWDTSATLCFLTLASTTVVWGAYLLLCRVHAAALVDRLTQDWN